MLTVLVLWVDYFICQKNPFKVLYLPLPFLAKAVIQYFFSALNPLLLFQKQTADETIEETSLSVQNNGGKNNAGSGLWFSLGRRSLILKRKRNFG